MVLDNPQPKIDPFKDKKLKAINILNNKEKILLNEQSFLSRQKRDFSKRTERNPLTINRQFGLSKIYGMGGVQYGYKKINESKKRARRKVNPRFSKAKEEIKKVKNRIIKRRSEIDLINENTDINFTLDLSKFKVNTNFLF